MAKWIKLENVKGVRYREHPERKIKNGVKSRLDRYYTIKYWLDGKDKEEALGWESDWKKEEQVRAEQGSATGMSLEDYAIVRLKEFKANKKRGTGPRTLKDKREQESAKEREEQARKKAEADAARTLEEYWKETYFPAAKLSKKKGSWEKEEQHFRIWIKPLLGPLMLRSISLDQWDELVKTLATGRIVVFSEKTTKPVEKTIIPSQRSREYITGTLRRIMKHAYDRRMVDDPPPTGKRIGISGPGNNRRLRVINYGEEQKIMEDLRATDPRAWKLTRFAFLTGCRVSEAFNLVQANLDRSRAVITFPETKNHDARSVPMTPALEELFKDMEQDSPASHVFTKKDGTSYKEAPSAFDTIVNNLGFNNGRGRRDRITFHSIRHTVATRLGQRLSLRDLMDVMGWRTAQMAMRYVHSNEDAKAQALSALGIAPKKGKIVPFPVSA